MTDRHETHAEIAARLLGGVRPTVDFRDTIRLAQAHGSLAIAEAIDKLASVQPAHPSSQGDEA